MATTGTGQGPRGTNPTDRTASPARSTGSQTSDRRPVGTSANTASTTASSTANASENSTANAGIAQTVKDSTYRSIEDQKVRASETLGSLAGAVRGMTQPLREGGQPQIADYVNKAADGIERWASELRQQDLEDAVRAVEQFARRQPAMFLGLAFGAGLVAARFLKSSGNAQTRHYGRDFDTTGGAGPTGMRTTDFGAAQFGTTSGDIPRVSSDIRPAGEVI